MKINGTRKYFMANFLPIHQNQFGYCKQNKRKTKTEKLIICLFEIIKIAVNQSKNYFQSSLHRTSASNNLMFLLTLKSHFLKALSAYGIAIFFFFFACFSRKEKLRFDASRSWFEMKSKAKAKKGKIAFLAGW